MFGFCIKLSFFVKEKKINLGFKLQNVYISKKKNAKSHIQFYFDQFQYRYTDDALKGKIQMTTDFLK